MPFSALLPKIIGGGIITQMRFTEDTRLLVLSLTFRWMIFRSQVYMIAVLNQV